MTNTSKSLHRVVRRGFSALCLIPAIALAAGTTSTTAARHGNNLGMDFVRISAGQFTMGSPEDEVDHLSREGPQHTVVLSTDFYMQVTEVTQRQWESVMGENPSLFASFGCSECPVDSISWNDAQEFVQRMNQRCEGTYRLPTEAEWEYAARAGTTTAYYFSDQPVEDETLDANAVYSANSGNRIQKVAQKQGNPWGLYDMQGNVAEWVSDWFSGYAALSVTDPQGLSSGTEKVVRGCSHLCSAQGLRSAHRDLRRPDRAFQDVGLRLVVEASSLPAQADCEVGIDAEFPTAMSDLSIHIPRLYYHDEEGNTVVLSADLTPTAPSELRYEVTSVQVVQ